MEKWKNGVLTALYKTFIVNDSFRMIATFEFLREPIRVHYSIEVAERCGGKNKWVAY